MASFQQESEFGDATNLVLVLAGELLQKADHMLTMGLTQTEITEGFL